MSSTDFLPRSKEDEKKRKSKYTKLQITLARIMRYVPCIVDGFIRVLGPILVLAAWALFGYITFAYFEHVAPLHGWDHFTFPSCFITPLGLFILHGITYNHIFAVFTPPGTPMPLSVGISSLLVSTF